MLNPSDLTLARATVQEIHLELIRRSQHNNFDGEDVLADLLAHREDWQAVLFDTHGLSGHSGMSGPIKLRDMAENLYNVDTLYILAVSQNSAERLAALAEPWMADTVRIYDQEETDDLLGGADENLCVVEMWWD
ncbi:MAG: hypothetical protein HY782_21245 [Chloroflexi bacterium]|nr:hypothetical protein [Chloroflexota bacterium]